MLPLLPTRNIMKTIKTNTCEDIIFIFRQVIRYLYLYMRSYQLHEFEYEMLADHIGGPECHEVWRGDCVDLGVTLHWALTAKHSYQQQQPKRLYTRGEVVRLATALNPGNCLSTSVEQYCICVQYYHWEADSRHRSAIPVSWFHELQQCSGIMPPKR